MHELWITTRNKNSTYFVGDMTSKQNRRSPSLTGRTVHRRKSSSITENESSLLRFLQFESKSLQRYNNNNTRQFQFKSTQHNNNTIKNIKSINDWILENKKLE